MDTAVLRGRLAVAARVVRARLRAVTRKQALDLELERELAFHYEQLVAEYVADGLSLKDAEQAARRAMGSMPLVADQCRDERRVTWIHDLRQDIGYAARMLVKHPGFTAVVVTSLALGIGANTAVLGVAHAVLRDPLPIPAADRVVAIRAFPPSNPRQDANATLDEYFAWAEQNQTLAIIGVGLGNNTDVDADGDRPAERLQGHSTTPGMFAALQVQPLLGRTFIEADAYSATPSRAPARAIVISHRLWQRRFDGAADIVGQTMRLNGVPVAIVGVMPAGFHYPAQVVDYWIPMRAVPSPTPTHERFFVVTARLKPGVSMAQAQADLDRITAGRRREPGRPDVWVARVRPIREVMYGWTRRPLVALGAAVALVLLVACTNIGGLLLARTLVREPEIAVRVALGAPRGRLIRQLLTESVLMASIGGALGVVVASAGVRALAAMQPPPGAVAINDVGLNTTLLAVMAAMSIGTGLLFGLAPALMASGSKLGEALKTASQDGGGRLRPRLREGLVAVQIAVTFVLLIGAGLATQTFVRLMSRELHFDSARMLTFDVTFPVAAYMQPRGVKNGLRYFEITPSPALMLERVYDAVRQLPGATAVAGSSVPLLNGLAIPSMQIATDQEDRREETAAYYLVTPGFFTALRAAVVAGRDFAETDRGTAPWVAVVNETAAQRLWPGEDPLGKSLRVTSVPDERPRQVVGIVRDIPLRLHDVEDRPVVYTSYLQQPTHYPLPGANLLGRMSFMVRTGGVPMALVPAVRRTLAGIVPDRPLASVGTMEEQIRFAIRQEDDLAAVLGLFALAAALLAGIGIYGVISYSVAQRTREIGIRMALGAGAGAVMARVGQHALMIVATGLVVGLAGSLAATPLLRSLVWEVSPVDPVTFAGAAVLLLLVCAVASLAPARRAASVNPTVALRSE